ncbi:Hypothetical protein BN2458_PEG1130 [Helicobacter typhlonius]|uniref:Uncharacterized protein n=1 Tax=Helicobacter typhlonius TaxID=76936 RepID=A0A0S4PUL3_9HELI|nr:Hypothetical protein BN2458_PEG1130 [Helicobacter typhlonius]
MGSKGGDVCVYPKTHFASFAKLYFVCADKAKDIPFFIHALTYLNTRKNGAKYE